MYVVFPSCTPLFPGAGLGGAVCSNAAFGPSVIHVRLLWCRLRRLRHEAVRCFRCLRELSKAGSSIVCRVSYFFVLSLVEVTPVSRKDGEWAAPVTSKRYTQLHTKKDHIHNSCTNNIILSVHKKALCGYNIVVCTCAVFFRGLHSLTCVLESPLLTTDTCM